MQLTSEIWQRLCDGSSRAERVGAAGVLPRVVFPGSFNPLHEGHRRMASIACRHLQHPVTFEISIRNVDKPPLERAEVAGRLAQFRPEEAIWLTDAPRFADKAAQFPAATFLVGIDTMLRLADLAYYGQCEARRERTLEQLQQAGSRFLVFGRQLQDRFLTLHDLSLPPQLRALCEGLNESDFRLDICSTDLRRRSRRY